jgi:hypothetical protein
LAASPAATPGRRRGIPARSLDLVLRRPGLGARAPRLGLDVGLDPVDLAPEEPQLVAVLLELSAPVAAAGWSVVGSLAWSLGLIAVFGPLAVRRYRRAS